MESNFGIEFINLPSIFNDKSVISSLPTYFENKESPIICYKYTKPIRSTVLNYTKLVTELDIKTSSPDYWKCNGYCAYNHWGFIVITDSRIWSIKCEAPKYRLPSQNDFSKCREEIPGSLQEFCNPWWKQEHVEYNVLNTWMINIF